ncbi:hypothetical protein EJV47_20120 [Hymenobacter gummosus]|uniref:Uncharacterized protein n=1 Tax=Hymenobacter gummosus TaxID=1776032 RepID=A0A3S0JC30_9BACT|nr:hypothetical protein [Hymenobacter gummosus]RTQ47203.1 hypothetical protein EJV47_20120 [Hymenobacter gummosus]
MKTTVKRITDRFPHLRDSAARQQMLVRNAVGSAQVEGIRPDEARLREAVVKTTDRPAPHS